MSRVSRRRRFGIATLMILLVSLGSAGFGLSGPDYAALLAFSQAVERWQVNPEFRTAAKEYAVLGSNGLQARPLGIDAGAAMMRLRALPFVPKGFQVSRTSQAHYDNFSAGPLRAYLHLCSEQSLHDWIPVIEEFARKPARSMDDCQSWLASRQMDYPVVHDDGAARSFAMLLEETQAERNFVVRQNIQNELRPRIAELAKDLRFPPEPERMSFAQQSTLLDRLDGFLKQRDPELWRTKQVSDFCGGIWAQVYGPPYNVVIVPVTRGHMLCRHLFAGSLVVLLLIARRRLRQLAATVSRPCMPGRVQTMSAPAERTAEAIVQDRDAVNELEDRFRGNHAI
jgi:hypothetical protein